MGILGRWKAKAKSLKKHVGASECCLLRGVQERGEVVGTPWVKSGDKKLGDIQLSWGGSKHSPAA